MSSLTVQNIQGSSSSSNTINVASGHKITGAAGSIVAPGQTVQIVKAEYTYSDKIDVNSTSYIDAVSINFTPKFNNSIIKHTFYAFTLLNSTSSAKGQEHLFLRDSTELVGASWLNYFNRADYSADYYPPFFRMFTDTPNTTSAVTYKLQIRNYGAGADGGWRLFDNNGPGSGVGNGVVGNWTIEEFAQ